MATAEQRFWQLSGHLQGTAYVMKVQYDPFFISHISAPLVRPVVLTALGYKKPSETPSRTRSPSHLVHGSPHLLQAVTSPSSPSSAKTTSSCICAHYPPSIEWSISKRVCLARKSLLIYFLLPTLLSICNPHSRRSSSWEL